MTDPEKVDAVRCWPTPTDVKELQSSLGPANYYHRFIEKFSVVADPLLCRKNTFFHWGEAQQLAFEKPTDCLTNAPCTGIPLRGGAPH